MEILEAIALAMQGAKFVNGLIVSLQAKKQAGEMTPAEEAQFDALCEGRFNSPAWKPSK